MDTAGIIICLVFAAASYILGIFQYREKGILLNNAWLYASPEERIVMDKKPYYRQSGIVFFLIGTIFLLLAIQVITRQKQVLYLIIAIYAVTFIYAIASSVHIERKKRL